MAPIRNYLTTLSLILVTITGFTQTTGIGQWREHLPYSQCIAVKEAGSKIYCATPYSIFYYDKDDNSIQRISKINGLSDIGISTINYSSAYSTLVIAYTDANVDLIKNNTIINMPDIGSVLLFWVIRPSMIFVSLVSMHIFPVVLALWYWIWSNRRYMTLIILGPTEAR